MTSVVFAFDEEFVGLLLLCVRYGVVFAPLSLVVYLRLVQWCHGAPGVIPMLTKAHEVFEDDR